MKTKDIKKNLFLPRVANIIEEARIGGPQIRNVMVALELKQKIDVSLIFPEKNSKKLKKKCKNININYIPVSLTTIKKDINKIIIYLLLFPFEVIKLYKILKKGKFDIVHLSGGCWQFKGIFAAKLAQKKVIWELNDTYSPIIVRWIFFFLSNLADGFIFASEKTKKYYSNYIPRKKKSFLIQSPVDTTYFDPNLNFNNENILKKKFVKNKILIGTVANINPVKDLMILINIAKKLSKNSNKLIFFVMGSVYETQKKYYNSLKNKITNFQIRNLFFLGPRDDTRSFLKAIDIYVCTSKNESSPLSVWEAMSMKKAIVSTEVGDIKKFIKNDINGFTTHVGDIDNLSKKIETLINKSQLRKKFGKKARQTCKKKLDIKICGKLHLMAYKEFALNK